MKTKNTKSNSELNNRIALTSGKPEAGTPEAAAATGCKAEVASKPEPRAIFFDGPFSKADPKGERDESPYWTVYLGRDWCAPVRTVYQVNSFKRAESLAQAMSRDRKLELVAEAMPA